MRRRTTDSLAKATLAATLALALVGCGPAASDDLGEPADEELADYEGALEAGFDPAAEYDDRLRHNAHRKKHAGAVALENRKCLKNIARAWAKHLGESGAFEHNPSFAKQITKQCAWKWELVGENIAYGPDEPAIFKAWLASAPHHQNIDRKRFRYVGIGAYRKGDTLYMVANFADPL
ncbi:MAG: hypothetical protein IPM35_17885 [Myxococcales bacterium]|nr:hypothetical protein [Myxococcales bacterium]